MQVNTFVNTGELVDTIHLDLQKKKERKKTLPPKHQTFAKILTKRLLKKLSSHMVRGKVYSWIRNWISEKAKGRNKWLTFNMEGD